MSKTRRLHFPVAILARDGEAIISAAETHTAALGERLPDGYLPPTRALLVQVAAAIVAQKAKRAEVGSLTQAQDTALVSLKSWITKARAVAKRTFPGQDVKLHEEFQVGVNSPNDLAAVLERADIILAGLKKAAHVPLLKAKGWVTADTTAFQTVRDSLASADETQENTKGVAMDATAARERAALDLLDRLLTIQGAANLQWPAANAANAGKRVEFRLSTFPPRSSGQGEPAEPQVNPSTPPPTPETPNPEA